MIIPRAALAAVLPATTKDSHFALHTVQIHPDGRCVATNGKILLIAQATTLFPDAEFPLTVPPYTSEPKEPFLLPADTAVGLIKATPKRLRIPILGCLQVSADPDDQHGRAQVRVTATDLKAPRTATIRGDEPQRFPNWSRSLPPARPEVLLIFAVTVLQDLLASAKAVGGTSIHLGVPISQAQDEEHPARGYVDSAVRVTIPNREGITVSGVAMPDAP